MSIKQFIRSWLHLDALPSTEQLKGRILGIGSSNNIRNRSRVDSSKLNRFSFKVHNARGGTIVEFTDPDTKGLHIIHEDEEHNDEICRIINIGLTNILEQEKHNGH